MRRRGTPADRGCVANSHQIVLGHLQQQYLPFSLCNFCAGFLTACVCIAWLLSGPLDER